VAWLQRVRAAFGGEESPMWENDGDRFRMEWAAGPNLVVRLAAVRDLVAAAYPGYYAQRAK